MLDGPRKNWEDYRREEHSAPYDPQDPLHREIARNLHRYNRFGSVINPLDRALRALNQGQNGVRSLNIKPKDLVQVGTGTLMILGAMSTAELLDDLFGKQRKR